MNIEVYSSLRNSEFDIRYSIFSYMILCLPGRYESLPYGHGTPTRKHLFIFPDTDHGHGHVFYQLCSPDPVVFTILVIKRNDENCIHCFRRGAK